MALAWKAGWVNSPQGFESPILRHADQRRRRDGLIEPDPAFGLCSRSVLSIVLVGLWVGPEQASHTARHLAADRVRHVLIPSIIAVVDQPMIPSLPARDAWHQEHSLRRPFEGCGAGQGRPSLLDCRGIVLRSFR